MKFAHVINPVKVPADSELGIAQPITFETIRRAKEFAAPLAIEVFAVGYDEDQAVIPAFIQRLPLLHRSILDLKKFTRPKKYPLLADVLQSLYEHSDADYLLFTNMDIALQPQFYVAVSQIVGGGYDAVIINRRGISKKYKRIDELPMMYSEFGQPHPGFDCFVFKRELFPKLLLKNICLGVSFSEVALVHNFIAFAERLKLVDELHLTFHIGTEVMPPLDPEYYQHNRQEYEQNIYPEIKDRLRIEKFPYSELSFYKRVMKWMLNPSFRTYQVIDLEGKSTARKWKYRFDTLRFRWLDKIR